MRAKRASGPRVNAIVVEKEVINKYIMQNMLHIIANLITSKSTIIITIKLT